MRGWETSLPCSPSARYSGLDSFTPTGSGMSRGSRRSAAAAECRWQTRTSSAMWSTPGIGKRLACPSTWGTSYGCGRRSAPWPPSRARCGKIWARPSRTRRAWSALPPLHQAAPWRRRGSNFKQFFVSPSSSRSSGCGLRRERSYAVAGAVPRPSRLPENRQSTATLSVCVTRRSSRSRAMTTAWYWKCTASATPLEGRDRVVSSLVRNLQCVGKPGEDSQPVRKCFWRVSCAVGPDWPTFSCFLPFRCLLSLYPCSSRTPHLMAPPPARFEHVHGRRGMGHSRVHPYFRKGKRARGGPPRAASPLCHLAGSAVSHFPFGHCGQPLGGQGEAVEARTARFSSPALLLLRPSREGDHLLPSLGRVRTDVPRVWRARDAGRGARGAQRQGSRRTQWACAAGRVGEPIRSAKEPETAVDFVNAGQSAQHYACPRRHGGPFDRALLHVQDEWRRHAARSFPMKTSFASLYCRYYIGSSWAARLSAVENWSNLSQPRVARHSLCSCACHPPPSPSFSGSSHRRAYTTPPPCRFST